MEIKRVNGVISAYSAQKANATRKTTAAVPAKNTDRVEFGFENALIAAKNGLAQEIKADATPQELIDAQKTAEQGVDSAALAAYILMG